MTPETLAATHARAFAGQGRAWSTAEFKNLLQNPHVYVTGDAQCFALGRVIADEAELLTLATDPQSRRRGLARAAFGGFEAEARARGAARAFLEVAVDNIAAQRLYAASGYCEIARRAAYYTGTDGASVDAVILEKTLTPRQPA